VSSSGASAAEADYYACANVTEGSAVNGSDCDGGGHGQVSDEEVVQRALSFQPNLKLFSCDRISNRERIEIGFSLSSFFDSGVSPFPARLAALARFRQGGRAECHRPADHRWQLRRRRLHPDQARQGQKRAYRSS